MTSSRFLLATDMDGTLLPNSGYPYDKTAYDRFYDFVASSKSLALAYISGRHLALAEEGIQEFSVPVPQYFVGDVGTSVYVREEDHWKKSKEWFNEIAPDFGGYSGVDVLSWFADIPGITPQEAEKQGDFKASFYYDLHEDIHQIKGEMQAVIQKKKTNMVFVDSIDHVKNVGLIDILPASATKEHALRFLVSLLDLPKESVLYCGDTGNDIQPLTSGFPAVLVGNAKDKLREEVRETAKKRGTRDSIYFAKKSYVEGIIEAMEHFGQVV